MTVKSFLVQAPGLLPQSTSLAYPKLPRLACKWQTGQKVSYSVKD